MKILNNFQTPTRALHLYSAGCGNKLKIFLQQLKILKGATVMSWCSYTHRTSTEVAVAEFYTANIVCTCLQTPQCNVRIRKKAAKIDQTLTRKQYGPFLSIPVT